MSDDYIDWEKAARKYNIEIGEKDATIARLEAENASLRGEAAMYQKEWAILREEVERLAGVCEDKTERIASLERAVVDRNTSIEQAEKELEKYKAFWEYSREADKLTWLHYHWEKK